MKYTSITHMQCMDAVAVSVLITRYEADLHFIHYMDRSVFQFVRSLGEMCVMIGCFSKFG